ncbi:MAG TPA: ribosomal RNA small subunit methyltransferase A [Elusimicrobia bacterium]|nr:MAG: ribosomal RNA small subunit methyltransferase A [Elusimicrobia bacterium GWD2_63_28]HCC48142.1 ribosomal RNA small subunit methyltransferase A [Elusimicrobiota bacterium]
MPKYSQVFLADKEICARIAAGLDDAPFDRLVEVGPGGGALTEFLFPKYGPRMKAVEIDSSLLPALRARFPGLEVVNQDFLDADLAALAGPGLAAFIGNLPYECSTAILEKVLFYEGFGTAIFMFQREVARRITAAPGDSDYGGLSVVTAARASAELLLDVKAASFSPVPAVESSVLVFKPRLYFPEKKREDAFRALVKKAFSHRRKTLVNSLALCGIPKEAAAAAVQKCGLKPTARAQELSLESYAVLTAELGGA